MSDNADPKELLELAVRLAAEAGRLLVEDRPRDLGVAETKSSPTDIVTVMDQRSEKLIVEGILAERPDDGILGEEGSERAGTSGVRWVIDPVDGTVNYLYELPMWAVSIGVEIDGEMAAGVVEIPMLRERFTAMRGHGAFLNGEPIRAFSAQSEGKPVPLERALVATGFGYAAQRRAVQGAIVAELMPLVRDIRRGGSAAIDLCSVACGRVDAYYERGAKPWDLAAGALIAQEAGAMVGGLYGAAASDEMTVAAADGLFQALREFLEGRNAARDS
ncbi:Inositol-phosphate phosphatase [Catenulispora acidiphila DSM 44928]|uniref:Inositol-1-monophosphatase n=1 Tax=Catenulispora acidiphila (strain DSM 44928 / JCM 14897 / NBRC 102108 / NRRL B-24433 / ID139908) TaxID=479433 RepID=C7QBG9_CATAD|nr:inositol monophosphatase family protein [Catenulispora acidiphila]ACU70546.1 Inositol-phosphate phosphatase [Catenulispora acidiphila DSM 44928]